MSRISKELAAIIAGQLVAHKYAAIEQLKKEYNTFIFDTFQEQTPKEVKDFFKKFPDYFEIESHINFTGHGFRWEQVYISDTEEKAPIIANKDNKAMLTLDKSLASQISKRLHAIEKAEDQYKKVKGEIRMALINLRTYKNITDKFPEAAEHLPKISVPAVIVNIEGLRKKIV